MAVFSRVNPTFPIPGVDQSSKGFRDNFQIIKTEIEALQGKTIQLTGDVNSTPVSVDSGNGPIVITTTGLVYRRSFSNSDLVSHILTVVHNLHQQFVVVQVSNNLNQVIVPTQVTLQDTSTVVIDLTSAGTLTGTWHVVIRG